MEPTQIEINKTKLNIVNLSNKLINTFNPSEEISINYELKKEVDFLLTLLTKKMNSSMNPISMNNNNINLFNPMMNNNIDINLFQQQHMQMMQQQLMIQQQQQQILQNQQKKKVFIYLFFSKDGLGGKKFPVRCHLDEKISDVIQRYRNESNSSDNYIKFIFNAKTLYPDSAFTVAECGLGNNSVIIVMKTNNVRGG